MFTVGSNGNNIAFGVKQLILDDKSDLEKLSETENMGTVCFVMQTSEYYMLNSKKTWIKINPSGSTTSGSDNEGDSPDGSKDIIYEGGII